MANNIFFPLNAPVNTESFDTTLDSEKISFVNKNTLVHRNVLGNPHYRTGNNFVSTTGKEIAITGNPSNITITCGNNVLSTSATKYLSKVVAVEPVVPGEILQVRADSNKNIFYIVKKANGDLVYCKNKQMLLTVNKSSYDDVAMFMDQYGDAYYCYRSGTTYTVRNSNNQTLYSIVEPREERRGYYAVFNNCYRDLATKGYVFGADIADSTRCWAYITHTSTKIYGFGCVGPSGELTGEPKPVAFVSGSPISLLTRYKILDNKVVKWQVDTDSTEQNNRNANLGKTTFVIGENGGTTSWSHTVFTEAWDFIIGYNASHHPVYALGNTSDTTFIPVIDISSDMGAYWKLDGAGPYFGDFDNVFPQCFVFTNWQANRGKFWDYGPGWSKCTVQKRWYWDNISTNKSVYPIEKGLYLVEFKNGTRSSIDLLPKNSSNVSTNNISVGDSTKYPGPECWKENARYHGVTDEEISSKQLLDWCYFIGGNASDGIVDILPFTQTFNGFTIQYYNGNPVSASMNKVLINTASEEMKAWWAFTSGSFSYLATKDYVYFIESLSSINQVEIKKIADYKYALNIISEYSFIAESREGTFDLVRAFNPFITEGQWDVVNVPTLLPPDGGASNDVWLQGGGHNVNLNADDVTTSYLLPATEVGIYVDSNNLDEFNKNIIKKVRPIINYSWSNIFNDDVIDIYFTHTLDTTDNKYRTSYSIEKGQFFESIKEDNTYWLTAETTIFPVGIGVIVKGINYIAPTIRLPGNYSARLYTASNTAFLAYNIANQVYYGNQVFTIYASSFYYDDQAIYYVGGTNDASQNSFVCYAIGMAFLANSGTEAYFYSPWEKRMYVFTGSNTMQAADSFARFGNIIDACYSSNEQALYILFEEGLWIRTQKDSCFIPYDINNAHLEGTTNGCAVVGKTGGWFIYSPVEGDTEPIDIETSYIGDEGSLFKYNYADIVLYNVDDNVSLNVSFEVLNGIESASTTQKVTLKKTDWKARNHRIRVVPQFNVGNSFKIHISSNDSIAIGYISVSLERTTGTPGVAVRSRT